MINIRNILLSIITPLIFVLVLLPASTSAFDPIDESCNNIPDTSQRSESEVCSEAMDPEDPITGTDGVILKIADVLAIIAGIIAVIVIIIAGMTMMTSSGDATKIKNSRNAIIYSIVGVIVVVLARSIVIFIINQTG